MNTQSDSMNVLYLINIHDVYNLSSINHNKILKKEKFFCVETSAVYAKQKHYYKRFQSASFCLKKIFIFKTIFVVE